MLWLAIAVASPLQQEREAREHLARHPKSADAWVGLARVVAPHAEPDALFHEALVYDPDNADAWAGLAQARARRGQVAYGLEAVEAALKAEPTHVDALATRVYLHAQTDRDEAVRLADEALSVHPEDVPLWLLLGALDPPRAADAPPLPELGLLRARHALVSGDATAASELLVAWEGPGGDDLRGVLRCIARGRLTAQSAGNFVVAGQLGMVRPVEALTRLNRLAVAPSASRCGVVLTRTGALRAVVHGESAALDVLRKAASVDPDEPLVQRAVGLALFAADKPLDRNQAGPWLARAAQAFPDDSTLALADVAANRGDLQPVFDRFPTDPEVVLAWVAHRRRDYPDASLDSVLAALEHWPTHPELLDVARGLATELGRYVDVTAQIEEIRALPDLPPMGDSEVDEEITVYGDSEVAKAREKLEKRLAELGYGSGVRRDDRVKFTSRTPITPWVRLYDDGRIEVQQRGMVYVGPGTGGMMGWQPISRRKMWPRYERTLSNVMPEVRKWRRAMEMRTFTQNVDAELSDKLDRVWHQGIGFDGSALATPVARRAALHDHWATRLCNEEGLLVRKLVARYLRLEVDESEHPSTPEEIAATNARTACGELPSP